MREVRTTTATALAGAGVAVEREIDNSGWMGIVASAVAAVPQRCSLTLCLSST